MLYCAIMAGARNRGCKKKLQTPNGSIPHNKTSPYQMGLRY